jgi:stage III sporulation protein AC
VEKSRRLRRSINRRDDVLKMIKRLRLLRGANTMDVDVNAIFQIAGIGIIIAMIHTVLKQMGKEDMAHWVTLIGFIVVLFMVVRMLDQLFQEIKTIFLFQ